MLDIFDLNYDLSNENIGQINKLPQFKNKGWLYGFLRFCHGLLLSVIKLRFNIFAFKSSGLVFFVSSHNQYKALQKYSNLQNENYVAVGVNYNNKAVKKRYPEALAYLLAIPFLPLVILQYLLCKDEYKKKSIRICMDRYLLSYGLYITSYICLLFYRPKMIAFSNDHCVWHRVLLKRCKSFSIKTFYCQHALVSEYFPPLEFDYTFLDGEIANEKYKRSNAECQVYLTGSAYLDDLSDLNNNLDNESSIVFGVCFNKIDSDNFIKDLIKELATKLELSELILVRLHPADNRARDLKSAIESDKVLFSDTKNESMSSYLTKVHALLAGDSSVHLEAALKGRLSCTLTDWSDDYYGFCKEGVVKILNNLSDYCFEVRNLKKEGFINKNLIKYKADLGYDNNIKFIMFDALLLEDNNRNDVLNQYVAYNKRLKSFVYKGNR